MTLASLILGNQAEAALSVRVLASRVTQLLASTTDATPPLKRPIRHSRATPPPQSDAQSTPGFDSYYMVDHRDSSKVSGTDVHDYGQAKLVQIANVNALKPELRSRITAIEDASRVSYRAWSGPADVMSIGSGGDGYYILTLLGPIDQRWHGLLRALDATIVDTAAPYGIVVRANGTTLANRGMEIRSSHGRPVIRGVIALPRQARLDAITFEMLNENGSFSGVRGARRIADGRAVFRVFPHADQNPAEVFARVGALVPPATAEQSRGYEDAFLLRESDVDRVLDAVPGVALLELQFEPKTLNTLAAKEYVTGAATQWTDLAGNPKWTGAGIVVDENDDGLDIDHPDFGGLTNICTNAHGVVIACNPSAASVNAEFHGTHVAGSVLGRGVASPQTGPCGEATTPLSPVKGMAYDAKLVINRSLSCAAPNCGASTEQTMMEWGYEQGARISTNSWGYTGLYTYAAGSRQVDISVRDADDDVAGNQDLLINFAAANDGPGASTTSSPGTAKNTITVGALESDRLSGSINVMADFSSRGPSQGRIRPDISAPGHNVLSVRADTATAAGFPIDCGGANYQLMSGTSMATPVLSGLTAQFLQFYNTTYGVLPKPATTKAAMINGAVDMGYGYLTNTPANTATGMPQAQNKQGWGRANVRNSIDGPVGGRIVYYDQSSNCNVGTGQTASTTFTVNRSTVPLKITLAWTDPPGAASCASCLINNLDLRVTAPGGTIYRGNQFTSSWSTANAAGTDTANNVENVFVQTPATGTWTIDVVGTNVATNVAGMTGQDYSVVVSADIPTSITAFTRSGCTGGTPASCSATVPAGVSATANGNNRIDVSWTPSGAPKYSVYRSEFATGPFSTLLGETAAPPYVDSTASGGTTYYYVIRASAAAGCQSGNSAAATATANGSCTQAPVFSGLTSATGGGAANCSIALGWSAGSSNCGSPVTYNVYRSTSSGFTPSALNRIATEVSGTSYTDSTSVIAGTTYYYVVRATANGIEDTNSMQRSAAGGGALLTTTLFQDNFDCNRQSPGVYGTTGGPWWLEQTAAGDTSELWHIAACSSLACATTATDYTYRWGGTGCTANYADDKNNALILGGDGTTSGVNGIVIPAGSQNVQLRFWHNRRFSTSDGLYLLYSTVSSSGPFNFLDADPEPNRPYIAQDGFTTTCGNGARCWGGISATMTEVIVNLDVLAGQTIWLRWRVTSLNAFGPTDTEDGYQLDDVRIIADVPGSCTTLPNPVQMLTATAGDTQSTLEWLNPASGAFGSPVVRVCTDATCGAGVFPANETSGAAVAVSSPGTAGSKGFTTHTGLTNNTTYRYAAFVNNGSGVYSGAKTATARPQLTAGATKWIYNTSASSMTPPGIGSVYAVSNDRWLHSMNPPDGTWPAGGGGWTPFVMNAPAQARPPVPTVLIGGVPTKVVYLGSQDGNVYCINATTGAQIWRTAAPLSPSGSLVQSAINGIFTTYGGAYNIVFAPTRHATGDNVLYAFNAATGALLWSFNNGGAGTAIGIITGDPWIEYSNRIYFTSRAKGNGSNGTLWCLTFNGTSASPCSGYPKTIGDSDSGPTVFAGKVYVGTNAGDVYVFDQASGNQLWTYATGDGPVKGFITPDFTGASQRLYFATTTRVWALNDNGTSASLPANWPITTIASPSVPVFTGSALLVGSSDGRLYELYNLTNASPSTRSTLLGTGSEAVGSPSIDFANSRVYVGTDAGRIYATSYPLP